MTRSTNIFVFCHFIAAIVVLIGAISESADLKDLETKSIKKRGIFDLGPIIKHYTGRSALDYIGYGCYCGYGGSGTPVDSTDSCCKDHDDCYTSTNCTQSHCQVPSVDCSGVDCVCTSTPGNCRYESCTCDVALGKCLSIATYNSTNKGIC